MKASFVVCLVCTILCEVFSEIIQVDAKPVTATDLVLPVGINTVSLKMPYCYFNNISMIVCDDENYAVWLVCSLTTAKSNYETNKETDFAFKYPEAFTSQGQNYFTVGINTLDQIPCLAKAPYNYLVGADGNCTTGYCNGVFPDGKNVSCKYVLINSQGKVFAETQWSDNIPLRSKKDLESLASGYSGRSGEMVAITSILSIAMGLLFMVLLAALIYICCCKKGTTLSNQRPLARQSLRIPSYNVHNLMKAST